MTSPPLKTKSVSTVIGVSGLCPRCSRDRLVYLQYMDKYDSGEWFKCDGCEHIFTNPPGATPFRLLRLV
jgi:hypothetical protein